MRDQGTDWEFSIKLVVLLEAALGLLSQLTHPLAQHVLVNVQVLRRLGHCHPTLSNQPDRLELELAAGVSCLFEQGAILVVFIGAMEVGVRFVFFRADSRSKVSMS